MDAPASEPSRTTAGSARIEKRTTIGRCPRGKADGCWWSGRVGSPTPSLRPASDLFRNILCSDTPSSLVVPHGGVEARDRRDPSAVGFCTAGCVEHLLQRWQFDAVFPELCRASDLCDPVRRFGAELIHVNQVFALKHCRDPAIGHLDAVEQRCQRGRAPGDPRDGAGRRGDHRLLDRVPPWPARARAEGRHRRRPARRDPRDEGLTRRTEGRGESDPARRGLAALPGLFRPATSPRSSARRARNRTTR